ncbi:hypothetical protein FHX15_003173 [Rhizobium sp. BK650]|nr:hypothetical protein [Rhizobium sp. BK650]
MSSAADHQSMRRYRRYGGTLWALAPDFLDYGDVAETMLAIDRDESGGQFASIITRNFKQRAIGAFYAFAHLRGGEHRSHLHSGRILPPMDYL